MNVQAISRDTFMQRARLYRDTLAGDIANRDYDFDAMEAKLAERLSRQRLHATGCDPIALL